MGKSAAALWDSSCCCATIQTPYESEQGKKGSTGTHRGKDTQRLQLSMGEKHDLPHGGSPREGDEARLQL